MLCQKSGIGLKCSENSGMREPIRYPLLLLLRCSIPGLVRVRAWVPSKMDISLQCATFGTVDF